MVKDDELARKNSLDMMTRPLSRFVMAPAERTLELHFRTLAARRMAALALAIRLYELDHGQRPSSLADLVPDYLDAMPVDPFAADGRTFGYLPDLPSPILYSVNSDGVDDGGEYALKPTGDVDLDKKDLPYFLNDDRPRKPLWLGDDK
jgi:hypothetical protein